MNEKSLHADPVDGQRVVFPPDDDFLSEYDEDTGVPTEEDEFDEQSAPVQTAGEDARISPVHSSSIAKNETSEDMGVPMSNSRPEPGAITEKTAMQTAGEKTRCSPRPASDDECLTERDDEETKSAQPFSSPYRGIASKVEDLTEERPQGKRLRLEDA